MNFQALVWDDEGKLSRLDGNMITKLVWKPLDQDWASLPCTISFLGLCRKKGQHWILEAMPLLEWGCVMCFKMYYQAIICAELLHLFFFEQNHHDIVCIYRHENPKVFS